MKQLLCEPENLCSEYITPVIQAEFSGQTPFITSIHYTTTELRELQTKSKYSPCHQGEADCCQRIQANSIYKTLL